MPGIAELVVIMMIVLVLPLAGFWVWMLVEVARYERGQDQLIWILVVLFAGVVGAAVYFFVQRPKRLAAR
jgi:hypothetical protein